jgi:hypothetical protein
MKRGKSSAIAGVLGSLCIGVWAGLAYPFAYDCHDVLNVVTTATRRGMVTLNPIQGNAWRDITRTIQRPFLHGSCSLLLGPASLPYGPLLVSTEVDRSSSTSILVGFPLTSSLSVRACYHRLSAFKLSTPFLALRIRSIAFLALSLPYSKLACSLFPQ